MIWKQWFYISYCRVWQSDFKVRITVHFLKTGGVTVRARAKFWFISMEYISLLFAA